MHATRPPAQIIAFPGRMRAREPGAVPIALFKIALNGAAWLLAGAELARLVGL